MSLPESKYDVEYLENGNSTVVVIDDTAYNLSGEEVIIHEVEDGVLLITEDELYESTYDEDGWLIAPKNAPDFVLNAVEDEDIRYADVDVEGFPIQLDASFRSDGGLPRAAWQREVIRPSMDIIDDIDGVIEEVTLTMTIESNGDITVTDVSVWPDSTSVSFDL